jgi:hypothetical protein
LRRECRIASAEPVCSCALSLHIFAHGTAGAARTRHSLLPLFERDNEMKTSGQSCRENAKPRLFPRHCEEPLRRSNPFFLLRGSMDCFAEPVIRRRFAPTGWLAMTRKERATFSVSSSALCAIAHWSGASSTPRLLGSIAEVSGILDRPVKPGDDQRRVAV